MPLPDVVTLPGGTMSQPTFEDRIPRSATKWRTPSLSTMIVLGLAAGIACGIVFGEYCAPSALVGSAFVGLLRMTVLPYIVVALVANLGRLSLQQSGRLALVGGMTMVVLWGIGLFSVFALAQCFPAWKSGAFFSSAITNPPAEVDLLELFIPSNFFAALAENHVPAVVVLCLFAGLALAGLKDRQVVIAQLDVLAKMLVRVSGFVTRLAPVGVFAIAAATAGTVSLEQVGRLQTYLVAYTGGAAFLAFVVLPWLITTCTPFRYRDVMQVSRDALVTAFATGKLIVVLPLLIEQTERLFAEHAAVFATVRPRLWMCCIRLPIRFPTWESCSACCSSRSPPGSWATPCIGRSILRCWRRGCSATSAGRCSRSPSCSINCIFRTTCFSYFCCRACLENDWATWWARCTWWHLRS